MDYFQSPRNRGALRPPCFIGEAVLPVNERFGMAVVKDSLGGRHQVPCRTGTDAELVERFNALTARLAEPLGEGPHVQPVEADVVDEVEGGAQDRGAVKRGWPARFGSHGAGSWEAGV